MDDNSNDEQSVDDEVSLEDFGGDGTDYRTLFTTTEVFVSDESAIGWAKGMAIIVGFELVISSHKNGGRRKILACSRGERYRGTLRDPNDPGRRYTKTKACRCKFRIKVYQDEGPHSWRVGVYDLEHSMHNHRMTVYPEGHRQISGLSSASKKIVRDMSSAQAKPAAILAAVREKHPEDHAHSRHVYNEREKFRRENYEDRPDVVQQFYHLAMKHNYLYWTRADPETNVLSHVFMVHPQSVNLLRTYPFFIGMDSTYKTNRYHWPLFQITGMTPANKNFLIGYVVMRDETEYSYRWALHKLRSLLGPDVHPTVIVTDREMGLMRPISDYFPLTSHMLCT